MPRADAHAPSLDEGRAQRGGEINQYSGHTPNVPKRTARE